MDNFFVCMECLTWQAAELAACHTDLRTHQLHGAAGLVPTCWASFSMDTGHLLAPPHALLAADLDPKLIARRATESYLIQILKHGFFHADPHPGNIAIGEGLASLRYACACAWVAWW